MWFARLRLALTLLLAIGVFTGIITLIHDWPNNYDVSVRLPVLTGYVRVTPRHTVIGGWRSSDVDPAKGVPPIWEWGPVALGSVPRDAATERVEVEREIASGNGSFQFGGFGLLHGNGSRVFIPSCRELLMPTWLACALGVVPLVTVLRARRRRALRAKHGECLACGYDLRASTGRCPECGAAVVPAPVPSRA